MKDNETRGEILLNEYQKMKLELPELIQKTDSERIKLLEERLSILLLKVSGISIILENIYTCPKCDGEGLQSKGD